MRSSREARRSMFRCRSVWRPSVLTFLIVVACGGLLMMIEKGMLNSMETRPSTGGDKRLDEMREDEMREDEMREDEMREDEVREDEMREDEVQSPAAAANPNPDAESQILPESPNRTIRTMCSQKNLPHDIWSLSPEQRNVLLQHILVNDEYHFLYCYVPKVACSNWKRVLKVLSGALESVNVNIKMNHGEDLLFLSSFEPDDIRYRLEHYFKFMFVREPMERLLSAYKNKFGEIASYQKRYGVEIIKRYRKGLAKDAPVTGDDVTFAEFVQYLLDEDVEHMNEHWMPMYNLCQPCAVSYDFIGSYDHLESDAEFVLQRMGAPSHVHFPERQAWYKPVTKETVQNYVCSLPQNLLGDLLPKYILDFSLFNYSLPNSSAEHCKQ